MYEKKVYKNPWKSHIHGFRAQIKFRFNNLICICQKNFLCIYIEHVNLKLLFNVTCNLVFYLTTQNTYKNKKNRLTHSQKISNFLVTRPLLAYKIWFNEIMSMFVLLRKNLCKKKIIFLTNHILRIFPKMIIYCYHNNSKHLDDNDVD